MKGTCSDRSDACGKTLCERLAHTVVQNMKENHFRYETSVGFLSNCCGEEVTRPSGSQSTNSGEL